MSTAVLTHAVAIPENMRDWTVVPFPTAMNLGATKVGGQGKGFSTYQSYLVLWRYSSIKPLQRRWTTATNTVRRGTPKELPTSLTVRCIRSSAGKRLLRMVRNIPIGISRIAETLCSGYPSTVSPHSNTGVIRHGQSSYSTIISLLTFILTSTTSSHWGQYLVT